MKNSRKIKRSAFSSSSRMAGKASSPRGRRRQNLRLLGQGLARLVDPLGKAALEKTVAQVAHRIGIEHGAEDGQDQDHHDPGQLGAGVVAGVEQIEGHDGAQHRHQRHEMGQIVAEPVEGHHDQRDLDQQEDDDQARAAEHRPQQGLLMLFQQPDAALVAAAHRRLPFLLSRSNPQYSRFSSVRQRGCRFQGSPRFGIVAKSGILWYTERKKPNTVQEEHHG